MIELFKNPGRDLATVIRMVTEELIRFLGADAGVIALLDADTGRLLLGEALGYGSTVLPEFIPLSETGEARASIVAQVVRSGLGYVAPDTRTSAIICRLTPRSARRLACRCACVARPSAWALASSRTRSFFARGREPLSELR